MLLGLQLVSIYQVCFGLKFVSDREKGMFWIGMYILDRNHYWVILLFIGLWFHIVSRLESSGNFWIRVYIFWIEIIIRVVYYFISKVLPVSCGDCSFTHHRYKYVGLLNDGFLSFLIQETRCWLGIYIYIYSIP